MGEQRSGARWLFGGELFVYLDVCQSSDNTLTPRHRSQSRLECPNCFSIFDIWKHLACFELYETIRNELVVKFCIDIGLAGPCGVAE